MIERDGPLSLSRQCALVGVSRSSLYYRPRGESAENLALMRRIDELHMAYPFYGSRQLVRHLRREGATAGRHRIRRLMRLMGVEATYRRPRTSVAGPEHRVFPYLLRGLTISRADHVWCADITHVPVTQGFFYLVAVMDWATRHVLAWRLSNTMDASFRVEALDDALGWRAPEILNTDQGAQFTSEAFADRVLAAGAAFSMDGRGPLPRQHLHRAAVAVAEVRGGVPSRAPRRSGRRTHHRLVVRLLQRGAPAFVPRRADAGRCLPQRHGGGVNGGSSCLPERAPVSPHGRGATRDLPMPGASRRRRPSPARRPGSPPGHRGPCWNLSFPRRGRTCGWSTHSKTTHGECFRGLSQPLGIHLNFALGLSNEVRPPHSMVAAQLALWLAQGDRPEEIRARFSFTAVDLETAYQIVAERFLLPTPP